MASTHLRGTSAWTPRRFCLGVHAHLPCSGLRGTLPWTLNFGYCKVARFSSAGCGSALRLRRFSSAGGRRALRLAPRTAVREKTALRPPHPGREETAIASSFIVNCQTPHFGTAEPLLMYEMRLRMRSVQERPFCCTEGVFGCDWYSRGPSDVRNAPSRNR